MLAFIDFIVWSPPTLSIFLFVGLTNKMRSDFNVMKDLSVHTRLAPEQRMREVGRLINYINK